MEAVDPDPRIAWVVAHMEQHLASRMAVTDLAGRVNLSTSRFRALFAAHTGMSPAHYLQWLRLQRARVLLERTFLSVREVRDQVGYHDPSHFTRDFRRLHGRRPKDVRAKDLVPARTGISVNGATDHSRPRARRP